jgi:hypothetical protein
MYITPEMLAFVGSKNPSLKLCWKVQVHIVKLMQNFCVCDVSGKGFKGLGKGLSLPDSFMDIVL